MSIDTLSIHADAGWKHYTVIGFKWLLDTKPMSGESDYGADPQALGREFYKFLSTSGLLKACPKFDTAVEWEIREQVNVQSNFAGRMLSLFENNDPYFTKLCQQMDRSVYPKYESFSKESKVIPFALLVNCALLQYESLKRCLLFALDGEKLSRMSSGTTYGTIIDELKKHGMNPRFVSCMDNELRNIIAHGSWYIKEGKFVYLAKEKTSTMSYEELTTRTSNFNTFAGGFFTLYWRDYMRKEDADFALTKMIEEGISKS